MGVWLLWVEKTPSGAKLLAFPGFGEDCADGGMATYRGVEFRVCAVESADPLEGERGVKYQGGNSQGNTVQIPEVGRCVQCPHLGDCNPTVTLNRKCEPETGGRRAGRVLGIPLSVLFQESIDR